MDPQLRDTLRNPLAWSSLGAVVLLLLGVVVWFTAPGLASDPVGVYAYEPLPDVFLLPTGLYGQELVGASIIVMGLLIAAVSAGFWWGRTARRSGEVAGLGPFSHPAAE